MTNKRQILNKLLKIAQKQQAIIKKLAVVSHKPQDLCACGILKKKL